MHFQKLNQITTFHVFLPRTQKEKKIKKKNLPSWLAQWHKMNLLLYKMEYGI